MTSASRTYLPAVPVPVPLPCLLRRSSSAGRLLRGGGRGRERRVGVLRGARPDAGRPRSARRCGCTGFWTPRGSPCCWPAPASHRRRRRVIGGGGGARPARVSQLGLQIYVKAGVSPSLCLEAQPGGDFPWSVGAAAWPANVEAGVPRCLEARLMDGISLAWLGSLGGHPDFGDRLLKTSWQGGRELLC